MPKLSSIRYCALAWTIILLMFTVAGCQHSTPQKPNEEPTDSSAAPPEKELSMGGLGNYFQEKYIPSNYEQKDVESDTLQWFCSSYAIYTRNNKKDLGYIGGTNERNQEIHEYALKDTLRSGWNIYDRDSLQDSLDELLSKGDREQYRKTISSMVENGLMDMNEEELLKKVESQNGDIDEFRFLYRSYQDLGEKALDGWDYCRALQVLGDCYQTGYISLEECLDQSLVIAQKLQSTFSNWDELAKSYLYGHYHRKNDSVATEWCWQLFEELKADPNGPYRIPYDTPLTANWKSTV